MGILQSIYIRLFGVKMPEGDMPRAHVPGTRATDAARAVSDGSPGRVQSSSDESGSSCGAPEAFGPEIRPCGAASDHCPVEEKNFGAKDVDKSSIRRILFICSGNICRSPYGEARMKHILQHEKSACQVASCGTLRLIGRGAAEEMIEAARERGLDLTRHRSQAVSKMLLTASDVIFVMSPEHLTEVVRIAPEVASRVVMLGMWLSAPEREIGDPMGKPPSAYRKAAEEIDEALGRWCEALGFQG